MTKSSVFMVAIALLLVPAQALAGVFCLSNQFGHIIVLTYLVTEETRRNGALPVRGAWLFGGPPCDTAPFVGSVVRDPQVPELPLFHFGLTLNGPNAAGCSPYSVQLTTVVGLGWSGFAQNLIDTADRTRLTLTAVECPTLPLAQPGGDSTEPR